MKRFCVLLLLIFVASFAQEVGARYLIITHDNFYSAIQPLAEWKHKKGMRTKVVKLSEIGGSSSQIRNYIINAYNNWQIRPEFLLLVGAPNYIPFPQIGGTYTDNYYTNIQGDIYNEILSGRFTVHNTTEAQTVVNKILQYERTPDITDPSWFEKACLIARMGYDPDDSIYWSDTYHAADLMINNGFVDIDTLSNAFGHNANSVIASVNSGRSVVMYRGTGFNNWYQPFDVNPDLTQNGNKLPIVLSITCRTIGTGSTPAFAEKWFLTGTPTTPRGGAGYFATTTSVYDQAYLRSAVAKGLFDAVFVDKKRTFAEACEGGRIRVFEMYQYQGGANEYYGFTTVGDPEMNLWTASPMQISVSHDPALNVGNDTLNVTVEYQGAPVESAFVCVLYDTVIYETGYTDNSGNIDFPLTLPDPGNLDLTVTGRNLYPFETTIPIISSDVYLIYDDHSVEDSLGNDDGIVNNGETILLEILIKNIGSILAQGVSATLRCLDTTIVIIDSVSHYGDIPSQSSCSGLSPFVFSVSPSCHSHTVSFDIVMKDVFNNRWFGRFSIQISGVGGGGGGEIGPDSYGYYMYDDTDTATGNAPEFDWFEIAPPAGGPGSIVSQITNDDDDTVTVSLPFAFKYYDINYNSIGLCSNGFLELGNATYRYGDNRSIPASGGPRRLVAPFWDNLNPGFNHMGHGDIYQYYDAANHRWILEFYQVAHRGQGGGSQWETFQTILLDPVYYPTPTEDGEMLFLYSVVARATGNTVGIEDHSETRGLRYVYNNNYHQNAAVLTPGRAILITTRPPVVGQISPWLYILDYTIDDSIGGNNNGIAEPNETIDITITIKNGGDTLANDVVGILRLYDSDATLEDSVSDFGDILINNTGNNLGDPYTITVVSNPADSTIGLVLYLTANNGEYETKNYFTIYIYIQAGIEEKQVELPLYSNHPRLIINPNPFTQKINIGYAVTGSNQVICLSIYDISGRLVKKFDRLTTTQLLVKEIFWNGTDDSGRKMPVGIYFIRLTTKYAGQTIGESVTRKIIKVN